MAAVCPSVCRGWKQGTTICRSNAVYYKGTNHQPPRLVPGAVLVDRPATFVEDVRYFPRGHDYPMLITVHGASWLVLDMPFPCEIYYQILPQHSTNDLYKVMFTHTEPLPFSMGMECMTAMHSNVDLIVSCHPEHLVFPNAVFAVYGGLFTKTLPRTKSFSASFIYSLGRTAVRVDGYAERTGFMNKADQVRIPLRGYRSRLVQAGVADHLPLLEGDRKDHLFESMFHVCFENSRGINYFTEKLNDCFATYTVPIYWGCPNISDYFNMDGIILADSHEHAIAILNDLNPADYWHRLDAMQDNFRRSRQYWDWVGRLRSLIVREYDKAVHGQAIRGFQA